MGVGAGRHCPACYGIKIGESLELSISTITFISLKETWFITTEKILR